jgi:hypothetical protein
MPRKTDLQRLLLSNIGDASRRVLDGKMPVAWAGSQLAALIRFWGYKGFDFPMPTAFERFDHVMTDLECFPDGRMTTDEQILSAARDVQQAAEDWPASN